MVFVFKFIKIFQPITDKLYIITGNVPHESIPDSNEYHFINLKMNKGLKRHIPIVLSFPLWLYNYINGQIHMSYHLLNISSHVGTVIFFLGYDYLLPIIVSRLLGKKTVMIVTTSSKSAASYYHVFYKISRFIEQLCYKLSDQLIICANFESKKLIKMYELEKHTAKLSFGGSLPVESDLFNIK